MKKTIEHKIWFECDYCHKKSRDYEFISTSGDDSVVSCPVCNKQNKL